MKFLEYMNQKYKTRKDKTNMYGVGISDAEFRQFIITYLLGEDYIITDPISQSQINEIALNDILTKYSKSYRKEKETSESDSPKIYCRF